MGPHEARIASLKRLTEATSLLPSLKPSRHRFISPQLFNEEHLSLKRPGLFPLLVSDPASPYQWSACVKWKGGDEKAPLNGLRTLESLQGSLVDVEISRIGRGYGDKGNDDAWLQTQMPFMMFHDAFIDDKLPFTEKDPSKMSVGYVAQQNLFELVPELQTQCPPLPHALAGVRGDREQWRRNVWIGGAGTFTPIHRDPYENLFAQVVGTKRVHLFPPSAQPYLRLDQSGRQSNTSTLPTEEVVLNLPHTTDTASDVDLTALVQSSFHAIVRPGDVLYVPQGWFHCVASLSVSASVNAWFR